jgi:hypothetical protein
MKSKNKDYDKLKDTSRGGIGDISHSGFINKEELNEMEGMCKFHIHNQGNLFKLPLVHILCETCNEMLCDKCDMEETHREHKKEDFVFAHNNDYVMNIFTTFYAKIRREFDEKLKNFKDKIDDVDRMVESFFSDEISRVEKTTQELISLLGNLNSKVRKLISMYQQKFKEEFAAIKEDYEKFNDEISNCKYLILIYLIYLSRKQNKFIQT